MNLAKLQNTKSIHRNHLHWGRSQDGNNERSEREIKKTIPFTTASERIKCLGINLPKGAKEPYSENYKMLMKEVKDDTNRWRDIHVLGLEESIL